MDSVDPVADSLLIERMRSRMDSIRTVRHRPVVALVLSGGGAKGTAHIGVKKLLDEMEIPVDMICGTSMGGMMGGLMSLGYDTEFLDSLLRNQDWSVTLTDWVDPDYVPYETKVYKSRYFVSVPFHYEKVKVTDKRTRDRVFRRHRADAELLLDARDDNNVKRSFASSLPAGYVYGFNVNNFLSSLSVGYHDSLDFVDMPVPFVCVAADMVSCKARNFGSGSVKTAMRSTMSIPGLFDPVRHDGMVLVDGGTRNNFPVDIARAMGADIIIGVELSNSKPDYSDLNNVGNIFSQLITMLGKDAYDRNVNSCDVFIKPDLEGFRMLSFNKSAIDTMISRGYEAALKVKGELELLKDRLPGPLPEPASAPAVNIDKSPVQLASISFDGIYDGESKILMKRIGLNAGQYVTKADMDAAMSRIQASGAFETVSYSLFGKEGPYNLVFDCVKGPVHRAGLGVRVDGEEWASLAFNIGLNTQKLYGSKLDFNAKLGKNQMAGLRYSLDLPDFPTLNAEFSIRNVSATTYLSPFKDKEARITSNLDFFAHSESLYLSNIRWTRLDVQLGLRNLYCRNEGHWRYESSIAGRISNASMGGRLSAFAKGTIYTLDDSYYPTRGMNLNVGYDFGFIGFEVPDFHPVHSFNFDYLQPIQIGRRIAFIPEIHARFLIDNVPSHEEGVIDDACSYYNLNLVGGDMAGRYKSHQIPFLGFNGSYLARDKVVTMGLDFRVNPVAELFVSLKGAILKDGDGFDTLLDNSNPLYLGAAFEVGYNTIIGPVKANVHWSDFTNEVQAYFSIGYNF